MNDAKNIFLKKLRHKSLCGTTDALVCGLQVSKDIFPFFVGVTNFTFKENSFIKGRAQRINSLLLLAHLESAYSLILGSHEIWGKGGGNTLALL